MRILFSLRLPHDDKSVPMVRHLCGHALLDLGVTRSCVEDVEIAVTEACTNVLRHASQTSDVYEVEVEVSELTCSIRVIDAGGGFDHVDVRSAEDEAESGRGIYLMKALVDDVRFESRPHDGTVVHLFKTLSIADGSLLSAASKRTN